ncbi:hypothetical protein O1D97_06695 [Marinomonas sp. 15G1-11]|uniref:Tetratricopeptide repeat protein n=1 Tax=Marinomonas phaeophyticola TaxID=3004091 RepID=A0ABT4JSH7_9GAMM|nr:tetratricopeptide repeat protein [Marinomonas sp. 15G1-11]MCZ2721343.1 hypothetical protein [Marinomonas sp. 15G1-11]
MTFILGLSLNSSYLLAAPHSITSPSCPSLPEIKHQPSTSQWIEIRQQLGAQLNYCLNDSAFFALYGASLLHSGLTAQSIEYLERALLLNPNNGSALIDYSEALYKSDQLLAAIQVNDQILSRHDLPEYLRVPLTERGKEWGNQRIEWQNKVSLASGYHDNLNGVANLKDLILTFDDRDIIVRLDENSRPIAGDYQTINASSQRSKLFDDGFSRFSVNVSSRTSELSRVDTDSVGLSYEKETLLVDGSFIWDLDSQYVFFGGKGLYLSSSSSASRYWRQERCSTYVTTEGRSLYFPDQPQSNEMALELQWGALCGPSNNQIDLSFSVAHNESLDHRPGGDRFIQELALQWKKSIGNGFLLSEISFSTTNDEKGYNPLLSNNEIRSVNTTNASVRFFYPLSKHLMLQSGLYYQGQDSNLSLFETQSKSADIGFTFSF